MTDYTALIERFKAGDHESFETLIRMYRANALSFAKRYIKDGYMAEDIVQESFADIYVYRDRYKSGYSFKTYLFSIIRNKAVSCYRKRPPVSLESEPLVDGNTPEAIVLKHEEVNLVRKKINELSEDYRAVLYFLEYEDLNYQEIARILGRSLGQVKILIFRARKRLRALLEKEV